MPWSYSLTTSQNSRVRYFALICTCRRLLHRRRLNVSSMMCATVCVSLKACARFSMAIICLSLRLSMMTMRLGLSSSVQRLKSFSCTCVVVLASRITMIPSRCATIRCSNCLYSLSLLLRLLVKRSLLSFRNNSPSNSCFIASDSSTFTSGENISGSCGWLMGLNKYVYIVKRIILLFFSFCKDTNNLSLLF